MTFYLPNTDVRPTGFEPGEFIDLSADELVQVTETVASSTPEVNGPLSVEGPLTNDQVITDVITPAAGETR